MAKYLPLVVLSILLVSGCAGAGGSTNFVTRAALLVDDFEGGLEKWDKMATDSIIGDFSTTNDAKDGKGALHISFTERKKKGGWFTVLAKIDTWPEGANQISFWAKGEKPTNAKVYINLGAWPDMKGFASVFNIETEWNKYTIPLSKFKFDWGMGDNKTLDISKINGVGFEPKDIPATFLIDNIQIENSRNQ